MATAPPPSDNELELTVNGHTIEVKDGLRAGVYYRCTTCNAGFTDWDDVEERQACGDIDHLNKVNETIGS